MNSYCDKMYCDGCILELGIVSVVFGFVELEVFGWLGY